MTSQALPYISILGFFFGSTLIASRFSVGQFAPSTYVGLRLVLAGLAHMGIYALYNKRYHWPTDRRLLKHAVLLGIVGTAVPMTFIVTSLQYLSSGIASVMVTTGPAIIVLMANFVLPDEKLTRRTGLGVILALGGAVLLALSGESGLADVDQANPLGYILLFTALICGNGMSVYARKYMSDLDSFNVASVRMVTAALVVMPALGFYLSVLI